MSAFSPARLVPPIVCPGFRTCLACVVVFRYAGRVCFARTRLPYQAATEAAAAARAAGRRSQAAADAALAREAAGREVASLQQQYRRLWLALEAAGARQKSEAWSRSWPRPRIRTAAKKPAAASQPDIDLQNIMRMRFLIIQMAIQKMRNHRENCGRGFT